MGMEVLQLGLVILRGGRVRVQKNVEAGGCCCSWTSLSRSRERRKDAGRWANGGHDRQPGMHTHIVTLGTLPHLVSHVCTHTTGAQ